jgi:hypothetical protein
MDKKIHVMDRKIHVLSVPSPPLFNAIEPKYLPQRVSEGSTNESEKSKEVGMTPSFRNKKSVVGLSTGCLVLPLG